MTYAHGYLAGVISSPELIMPSVWLEGLYQKQPTFDNLEQAQQSMNLIMKLNNHIADQFFNGRFNPLYWDIEQQKKSKTVTSNLAKDWCSGYADALDFYIEDYADESNLMGIMPILLLAGRLKPNQDNLNHDQEQFFIELNENAGDFVEKLSEIAQDLHNMWFELRMSNQKDQQHDHSNVIPLRKNGHWVGRNELCPCGSGKKYKKCCLIN